MSNTRLTEMEIDVIGEVMNISMGAAATAMSTILDKKVNITTPRIEIIDTDKFEFTYLEPVVGVLIKYIEGIDGTNMLLLKEEDLKKILGHLLSMDPKEIKELDEISVSAICEIMNQMMGSASSALASFLGQVVNISPPDIIDTAKPDMVRNLFSTSDILVNIKFYLSIEGLIESEFISAMEPGLAKEIVKMSIGVNDISLNQPEATSMAYEQIPVPETIKNKEASQTPQPVYPSGNEAATLQVHAVPYTYKPLNQSAQTNLNFNENNLEMIMSVPVQITVELGRTRKKIRDIAELTIGNIIELDRQAGDQVDVVANGRLIARGDVVVVDDNYSVKITEIVKLKESSDTK